MDQITVQPMRAVKAGVSRIVKNKLKIDMTPMVDLGFLLISFFIFTTQINKPTAMNLNMPIDGPPIPAAVSKTITFLMSGNNKLFYYAGKGEDAIKNNLISLITYDEKNGIPFSRHHYLGPLSTAATNHFGSSHPQVCMNRSKPESSTNVSQKSASCRTVRP